MNKTPHYYVQFAQPLPVDVYFASVDRLKRHMESRGYQLDEFGDTDEADKEAVRRDGGSDCFEGQVVYPPDDGWIAAFRAFVSAEGLEPKVVKFDD